MADESSAKNEPPAPVRTPSDEVNANVVDKASDEAKTAEDFLVDGKNKHSLLCIHCPSKMLAPGMAVYLTEAKDLPKMNQKKNCPEIEVDEVLEWFVIDDMFQFENIGVSHSVGSSRFLTCADCEMGPVGWNDLDSQKCYIALSRVKQE